MRKYLLMVFSIMTGFLSAEIEYVAVNWTPLLCQEPCEKLLYEQFKKIPAVAEIAINRANGTALLTWKERAPFSSVSVKTAMKMVGIRWRDIRVRVQGEIRHREKSIFLISKGDGTSFELINPVVPDLNQQSIQFNKAARYLRPELIKSLLEAEKKRLLVTIEGPLFMPERSPELILVVERLQVAEEE